MRCTDVHDALLVLAPLSFWGTPHLAEYEINFLYSLNAIRLKDAVGNASPRIICGELHFHAERADCNIGKGLRVRIKIYSDS